MKFLKSLWNDDRGAIATEYVILVGIIAIALILGLVIFKDKLIGAFDRMGDHVDDVAP